AERHSHGAHTVAPFAAIDGVALATDFGEFLVERGALDHRVAGEALWPPGGIDGFGGSEGQDDLAQRRAMRRRALADIGIDPHRLVALDLLDDHHAVAVEHAQMRALV